MKMNPLVETFKKYGTLTLEMEYALTQKAVRQERSKGDYYLKEGQTDSGLFVIEKGLVRAFFHRAGKEVNSWFGTEAIVLGSIHPLFFHRPAKENIQFLEHTILHTIGRKDLAELYEIFPALNLIGRLMAEEFCALLEERMVALQTMSATERYEQLVQTEPNLLQRVSLGHIASYLGVSLETLSCIRGKM